MPLRRARPALRTARAPSLGRVDGSAKADGRLLSDQRGTRGQIHRCYPEQPSHDTVVLTSYTSDFQPFVRVYDATQRSADRTDDVSRIQRYPVATLGTARTTIWDDGYWSTTGQQRCCNPECALMGRGCTGSPSGTPPNPLAECAARRGTLMLPECIEPAYSDSIFTLYTTWTNRCGY